MEPSQYFKNISNHSNFSLLTHRLSLQDIPTEGLKYKNIPFDLYFPSLKKKLSNGICDKCNKYWPSEAAMKRHKKAHKKRKIKIERDSDVSESEDVSEKITKPK